MADGHRCVLVEQKHRHGLSYDVTAPDHHRVLSCRVDVVSGKQFHDPRGSAGNKIKLTGHNSAHVFKGKSIHVFFGIDPCDHLFIVNVLRHGKLYQNSVNFGVCIQIVNEFQKLLFRGIASEAVFSGKEAHFLAGLLFVSYVDLGSGVLPYQNHRKTGANPCFACQFFAFRTNFISYVKGNLFSVNDLRHLLSPFLHRARRQRFLQPFLL